jgi:hypothetical protein
VGAEEQTLNKPSEREQSNHCHNTAGWVGADYRLRQCRLNKHLATLANRHRSAVYGGEPANPSQVGWVFEVIDLNQETKFLSGFKLGGATRTPGRIGHGVSRTMNPREYPEGVEGVELVECDVPYDDLEPVSIAANFWMWHVNR